MQSHGRTRNKETGIKRKKENRKLLELLFGTLKVPCSNLGPKIAYLTGFLSLSLLSRYTKNSTLEAMAVSLHILASSLIILFPIP
jgi:hypothetical protein